MTPAERIAGDTWERIRLSKGLSVRLGEETLTDLLSLDFTRLMSDRRARLWQTTKAMESKQGTDLRYEWLAHPGPVEGGWPDWLWERDDQVLSEEDCRNLQGDDLGQDIEENRFAPRRLLLVDPVEEDETTEIRRDDAQPSPARNPRP